MLGTKITGDHIVLRPLIKADIENRVKWFNDPDVRKSLIVSEQFELEKTIRWFEKIQADGSRVEFVKKNRWRRRFGRHRFHSSDSGDIHCYRRKGILGQKRNA